MVTVPYGVTSVESRAVHEATLQAGSREAYLVQQPLAAALGVDLPIGTPSGNMLICLGGGATQAAVMAMYGIVSADTLRAGGMALDEAIIGYVRKKYGLIIGQLTAEQVKIRIGAAVPQDEEQSIEIQGQDQVSGLPRPATLTTGEVVEALRDPLARYHRYSPPGPRKNAAGTCLRYYRPRCSAHRRRGSAARDRQINDKRTRNPGLSCR